MTERANPFLSLNNPPTFEPKPRRDKPVPTGESDRIAEEENFPSRQAPKVSREPKRKRRAYTTGRNRQVNFKATAATVERFYKMADQRKIALCVLFEQALDALERARVAE